jgi:hypothetical protein
MANYKNPWRGSKLYNTSTFELDCAQAAASQQCPDPGTVLLFE